MPSETGSRLMGLRVLIVEDEYLVALDLQAILAELGCRIVGPASTLPAALRLLREAPVDLAILDVKLDRALVYPAARDLMARRVPFLFMTGYPEAALPAAFGAVPCLPKPFDPAALRRLLERLARYR